MPTRLNLGSGPALAPGWLNADKQPYAGLDACGDLRAGLPLPAASIDAIVAMHVLQIWRGASCRGRWRKSGAS